MSAISDDAGECSKLFLNKHLLIVPHRILWLSHSLFPPWTSPWSLSEPPCQHHSDVEIWRLPIFIDSINKSWWKPAGAIGPLVNKMCLTGSLMLQKQAKMHKDASKSKMPIGRTHGKEANYVHFHMCIHSYTIYVTYIWYRRAQQHIYTSDIFHNFPIPSSPYLSPSLPSPSISPARWCPRSRATSGRHNHDISTICITHRIHVWYIC